MNRYPLNEWLKIDGHTQAGLAEKVRVTQGAISQASRSVKEGKKQVFVILSDNGEPVDLEYIKAPRRIEVA